MYVSDQKFGIKEKKENNFSEWYTQILLQGNMIDYYDIKGCFIMKSSSMFLWNKVKDYFTKKIEELGVEECYFPMLVTKGALEKEKSHIDNFAPELAWITKCGDSEIHEPVAVRPTSEAIMYPAFSKWLRSYRELPLKYNQWCSVLRWEVKSTFPFIRGREFLWQEGHTVFLTKEESDKEVKIILDFYEEVYRELLAVPVIKGRKSENEKFGGADYTLTVEAFIPETGKGVQAATSHSLGQNFSKMFEIQVEDPTNNSSFVYQNSWAITTRCLGIAIMIHSDNKGLVLPPRIAKEQIIIIPCGVSSKTSLENKERVNLYLKALEKEIKEKGLRVKIDDRDNYLPGYKFNYWELQGIPLRIEVGLRDMEKDEIIVVRRLDGVKKSVSVKGIGSYLENEINSIHNEMYEKAQTQLDLGTVVVDGKVEFLEKLNQKNLVKAKWCGSSLCEENIKEFTTVSEKDVVVLTGAKSMCIMEDATGKCFNCEGSANHLALFGRTY